MTTERQVPLNGAGATDNSGNSGNSLTSLKRFTPEEMVARKANKEKANKEKANFKKTNNKRAKPVKRVDVEKLNAEKAAANLLVEKLRSEITTVSCVCTGKKPYGAFYRVEKLKAVTTPGETLGLTGLWHVSDMPGGATELAAIAVDTENTETAMEFDIIGARVENAGGSPIVKLSFNLPQST